nr:MAG TPA: hypothetical protein [Caudoviricetes sp.]
MSRTTCGTWKHSTLMTTTSCSCGLTTMTLILWKMIQSLRYGERLIKSLSFLRIGEDC